MNSLIELGQLVRDGETDWKQHGEVKATYWEGLVLFNYTAKAQYEGTWNWFERNARGLILDAVTGEVVARPFERFLNWGHGTTDSPLKEVTEKVDGSLAIGFKHRGEWRIATRGSFESEQALWATEFLKRYDMSGWLDGWTPLWEMVYPSNRIVVDYGDREDLVLIGVRNIKTGYEYSYSGLRSVADMYLFSLPGCYQFDSIGDVLKLAATLDGTKQEGWVLRFEDGSRFKVKGDRYLELHRLIHYASFKHVLEAVASGTYDDWVKGIPDEFLGEIRGWRDEIEDRVEIIKGSVEANFVQSPGGSRKGFALWVRVNCPELSAYMFARLDGRDYVPMIYREMGKEK